MPSTRSVSSDSPPSSVATNCAGMPRLLSNFSSCVAATVLRGMPACPPGASNARRLLGPSAPLCEPYDVSDAALLARTAFAPSCSRSYSAVQKAGRTEPVASAPFADMRPAHLVEKINPNAHPREEHRDQDPINHRHADTIPLRLVRTERETRQPSRGRETTADIAPPIKPFLLPASQSAASPF